jgi:hypothetical protein
MLQDQDHYAQAVLSHASRELGLETNTTMAPPPAAATRRRPQRTHKGLHRRPRLLKYALQAAAPGLCPAAGARPPRPSPSINSNDICRAAPPASLHTARLTTPSFVRPRPQLRFSPLALMHA